MLREALRMELGGQYAGGNARMVEKVTRCRGEEFLYVGDHIFTDVNMAKRCLSWRTCMILQARNSGHLGPSLAWRKTCLSKLRANLGRFRRISGAGQAGVVCFADTRS